MFFHLFLECDKKWSSAMSSVRVFQKKSAIELLWISLCIAKVKLKINSEFSHKVLLRLNGMNDFLENHILFDAYLK